MEAAGKIRAGLLFLILFSSDSLRAFFYFYKNNFAIYLKI